MTSSPLPIAFSNRATTSGAAQSARGFSTVSRRIDCSTRRFEIVDLTARIAAIIEESGVANGLAHIQSLHTTTALFLNECQAALLDDVETLVRQLVEEGTQWRHNDRRHSDCERGNAAAHLRSLLVGQSLTLQVENGQPVLGRWQAVLFLEMDGPQNRQLSVQVMGV